MAVSLAPEARGSLGSVRTLLVALSLRLLLRNLSARSRGTFLFGCRGWGRFVPALPCERFTRAPITEDSTFAVWEHPHPACLIALALTSREPDHSTRLRL